MELPENRRVGEQGGKYGIIASLLLIVAIISIAFLVYVKNQGLDLKDLNIKELISNGLPEKEGKKAGTVISEFKYNPEEATAFGVYGSYIIKCMKDSIVFLDKDGEEQWSKPVSINNPLVKSAGSYLMVADLGGKDVYVIKGKNIRWSEKLDNTIINADINDKGYVSVVTEMKGYKGAVAVYDAYGNWIFTTARSEDYILSARVLSSDRMVLLNTVNSSGSSVNTNLEFVDMEGNTHSTVTREDEIIPSVWSLSGGWIAAASSRGVICFNSSKEIKWKHDFDRIYSSDVLSGKYLAVAVEGKDKTGILSTGKTYIKLVDSKGEPHDIYNLEGGVVNLEAYDGVIAVNAGREIHFINSKGNLEAKYTSKIDVDAVRFFSKNEAAVISKNSVTVVNIK